ncbi:unnamed protein product, partial [Didymodactylos carnosus]
MSQPTATDNEKVFGHNEHKREHRLQRTELRQLYAHQLSLIEQQYPNASSSKLLNLLRRHDGDVDKVCAILKKRSSRQTKFDQIEQKYGPELTKFLEQESSHLLGSKMPKRQRLLRIMERSHGDQEHLQKFLNRINNRHQNKEEAKEKYVQHVTELEQDGLDVKRPCVYRLLEKHDGDLTKVRAIMQHRLNKKTDLEKFELEYDQQLKQLELDGVHIRNKRAVVHLLQKSNGQLDTVKEFLLQKQQRKEKKKRDYSSPREDDEKEHRQQKKARMANISVDDLEYLKQLRVAGVHGNPIKILKILHEECNDSVELTIEKCRQHKDQRKHEREERLKKRELLNETQQAYLSIISKEDWPSNIDQVYLDGNNMMFVIDSLRRLCLNRQGKKTENIIGQIASAWNEKLQIPHVNLIYDSTNQVETIGTVNIQSARPKYKTTDDMLIDLAKQNHGKNEHTIVVTADRALAVQ